MHYGIFGVAHVDRKDEYIFFEDYELMEKIGDCADYVVAVWNNLDGDVSDDTSQGREYLEIFGSIFGDIPGIEVSQDGLGFTVKDRVAVAKYAGAQIYGQIGERLQKLQEAREMGQPIGHQLHMLSIDSESDYKVIDESGEVDGLWTWLESLKTGSSYALMDIYDYHY